MIRIKCTSCARVLGIDDTFVGKPAFCPACGLVFTVPAPALLLEGLAARPTHVEAPQTPAAAHHAPKPTAEPRLPNEPIRLAGDTDENPLLDPWRLPQTPAAANDQIHTPSTA